MKVVIADDDGITRPDVLATNGKVHDKVLEMLRT